MGYPNTRITCVSNLWLRQMHFVIAGDCNEGHIHNYDHVTLLAKGRVEVNVEGVKTVFSAPQMILVTKGKMHFLTALDDDTVAYCIHALRTGEREEDILDPASVPNGINPVLLAKPL